MFKVILKDIITTITISSFQSADLLVQQIFPASNNGMAAFMGRCDFLYIVPIDMKVKTS